MMGHAYSRIDPLKLNFRIYLQLAGLLKTRAYNLQIYRKMPLSILFGLLAIQCRIKDYFTRRNTYPPKGAT